jgi:hypothetical protein
MTPTRERNMPGMFPSGHDLDRGFLFDGYLMAMITIP